MSYPQLLTPEEKLADAKKLLSPPDRVIAMFGIALAANRAVT
ncbi:hypothetical protein GCM10010383_73000 [Streptomyces lomondensis]|uniref:Uncharacterized protein n=1 Tax=Streptomyces lomondensis TaxID=68229 RepID=A0ABQ2XU48_9ACTN|nr:hypothetical protein GCM10010383_73000 [Streptomyces lomondensis]